MRDNGPGVPNGIEEDIFTSSFGTRKRGCAIGLVVVRKLDQRMGGTVRQVRRASGGAAFVPSCWGAADAGRAGPRNLAHRRNCADLSSGP